MKLNFQINIQLLKSAKLKKLNQTSCYFPPKFTAQNEFERKIPFHDQPRSQFLCMNVFQKGLFFELLAFYRKPRAHFMRMIVFPKSTRIDSKHVEAHPVFRNKPGQ